MACEERGNSATPTGSRVKHLWLVADAFTDTASRIFTSVPLSSMLEQAAGVKKQNKPLCRISDTRKECVDEDVG